MSRRVIEETLLKWLDEGRPTVTAQLIEIIGSAPLDPGATMLISDDGHIEGSVTGGCVEAALVDEAQKIFNGDAARVATYGISDELAGEVGLMCGGTVRILLSEVESHSVPALRLLVDATLDEQSAAIATLVDGPAAGSRLAVTDDAAVGTLGVADLLDSSVARDARGLVAQGLSMIRSYGSDGAVMGDDLRVFVKSYAPRPRMVIFGAIDFSVALARLAREAGYRVTICDARKPFIASSRFSEVAEVVSEWPDAYLEGREFDRRDALLVFTHDPKFDEPALISALQTDAGYIGALGSRRTDRDRRERLRQAGVTPDELERVTSPCGLDIGSSTPIETAIAILAEITALRAGRVGDRLVETTGPIRRRPGLDGQP
jgi:xanthine dehydrogenase accessory factor